MSPAQERREKRLCELWARRSKLTSGEWSELYNLVKFFLRGAARQDLMRLPDGLDAAENYIADFFSTKVYCPKKQDGEQQEDGELHHAGALALYFARYLRSVSRDPYLRRKVVGDSLDDPDDAESDTAEAAADRKILEAYLDRGADADERVQILAIIDRVLGCGAPEDATEIERLVALHLGLELREIQRAAEAFLSGTGDWSELRDHAWWISLYLAEHACPEREDSVALVALKAKHGIRSYHYKAQKLGLTVHKGEPDALAAFRMSYLGRWYASLGIPVDDEHRLEMAIALKVLCHAALSGHDPDARERP